jgi:RNA polymerase sigma-70 factor (ECF subfamily)
VAVREQIAPMLALPPSAEEAPAAGQGCFDVVSMFSRRLEGDIEGTDCAQLEKHLETCPRCRGQCDSLKATLSICKRAGAAPVPADVARSVRRALHQFLEAHG